MEEVCYYTYKGSGETEIYLLLWDEPVNLLTLEGGYRVCEGISPEYKLLETGNFDKDTIKDKIAYWNYIIHYSTEERLKKESLMKYHWINRKTNTTVDSIYPYLLKDNKNLNDYETNFN